MEVGVCTEAYDQEMSVSRRHINSAFMTFVVLDEEGRPRTLPMVVPQPGVSTAVPLYPPCPPCPCCSGTQHPSLDHSAATREALMSAAGLCAFSQHTEIAPG